MTIPACHCEARKVAYRQTKDGLVVSFVIHPNDMPDALAVAPLGQRYMLALAAIGDDEKPIETEGSSKRDPQAGAMPATSPASQRGKERYASSTPMEQALVRAARLADDERFQKWVGWSDPDGYIRQNCCDGRSRALIAKDPDCYRRFIAMETEYKIATGLAAEVR